ncbi:MAG TPA: HAD-IC family P-type ATPase [Kofleriaceae bacterium]|nr:HAD-IC family P-type ATPase [Kofleriaceae bacterium]
MNVTGARRRSSDRAPSADVPPHASDAIASAPGPLAWHALPPEQALAIFASRDAGLEPGEIAARLREYGPNILRPPQVVGIGTLIVRQTRSPIVYLLLGSALLAVLLGKLIDGAVVLAAVVVNVVIGFVQELRAARAIEALSRMVQHDTQVVREQRAQTIPSSQLVPGDIVLLASGDHVPADVRLLEARNLRIDESTLTGESVATDKRVAPVAEDTDLGDRTSMAYGGTLVAAGSARGVVVATGGATELGRIAHLLEEASETQTPLTRAIASVGIWLTVAVLAVSLSLFAIGLARGYTVVDGALAAITLAVASVPEGLPAIITIALAIGVQRMAARGAVIRRLPTVETLGSTTVICSDKTGTLTRNEMTVRALHAPSGSYELSGVGYAPTGRLSSATGPVAELPADVEALVVAAALCSDASVHAEGPARKLTGDPTEGALVVAAMKLVGDLDTVRRAWRRLDVVPFESEHQFMATLHAAPDGTGMIFLKGAPEVVLRRCAPGALAPEAVAAQVSALASQGMRVLAVARKPAPPGQASIQLADVATDFELLGLEGMIDPPRPEASAAVATCHAAGITVKMITGDHVGTAVAIGRQLGLLDADATGITGGELARLDDDGLRDVATRTNVFARVAPEHKLRLVKALQQEQQIVAMTGDGVNDAPALKQADVGVAMGITGTAVSKEAADVVLADDNFATIAAAVEEGRRIYDNLVKSLAFVLPTNLGLGLILVVAVALFPVLEIGGEAVPLLPMRPTQMLWINMVASVALSLPLAFEVLEPQAMQRPPRRPGTPILGGFVITRTILVALLMCGGGVATFWWEYWIEVPRYGHEIALREAQTMAVTTVVSFQAFYLFNCRSLYASVLKVGVFSNPTIFLGVAVLLVLQAGFIYLPFMQDVFGTAALSAQAIGWAMLVAAIILPVISIEKALRSRHHRRGGRGDERREPQGQAPPALAPAAGSPS